MITLSMPGAFHAGWFEGTSLAHGQDVESPDRKLLHEVYTEAPRRSYGRRGYALRLSFPETEAGLDALDALFDHAVIGLDATAWDPADTSTQAACRTMVDRTLAAIRTLEQQLGVAPGKVTAFGMYR